MLIRDREQMEYLRNVIVRDLLRTEREIRQIKRSDVTAVDGLPSLETLERRVELAEAIGRQLDRDVKYKV